MRRLWIWQNGGYAEPADDSALGGAPPDARSETTTSGGLTSGGAMVILRKTSEAAIRGTTKNIFTLKRLHNYFSHVLNIFKHFRQPVGTRGLGNPTGGINLGGIFN